MKEKRYRVSATGYYKNCAVTTSGLDVNAENESEALREFIDVLMPADFMPINITIVNSEMTGK